MLAAELLLFLQTVMTGVTIFPSGINFYTPPPPSPDLFVATDVYTAIYLDAGLRKPDPLGTPWVPGAEANTASGWDQQINVR